MGGGNNLFISSVRIRIPYRKNGPVLGIFVRYYSDNVARDTLEIGRKQDSNLSSSHHNLPPPPRVAWFYATDIPKSKPDYFDWKPTKRASKYQIFSDEDSLRLERAYQKLVSEENTSSSIPVKEDGLFQVDLKKRELRPTYWDGPVYDVRRGTWFYSPGSKLFPCSERLSEELEDLYQQELIKLHQRNQRLHNKNENNKDKNDHGNPSNETGTTGKDGSSLLSQSKNEVDVRAEKEKSYEIECTDDEDVNIVKFSSENPSIIYAYKSTSTSVLQKIASSLGGSKRIVRGFRTKDEKQQNQQVNKLDVMPSGPSTSTSTSTPSASSTPPSSSSSPSSSNPSKLETISMPWLDSTPEHKLEEQMKYDYDISQMEKDSTTNLPVDHLILCVHGIGQKLSQKVESVNFVHDINVFRKLIKSIQYGEMKSSSTPPPPSSPITGDSQEVLDDDKGERDQFSKQHSLNKEGTLIGNGGVSTSRSPSANEPSANNTDSDSKRQKPRNRVQVLPVLWRHDISFGRKTHPDQPKLVSVQDINVEGVPAVRTLVSDVVADFLLYSEPAYRKQMLEIVTYQLNKIFREFCQRNPTFAKNPKVSIIAHSLGSVISYEALKAATKAAATTSSHSVMSHHNPSRTHLEFKVSNFFTLGSPLGMFLLISGSSISPTELNVGSMYNVFHPSDPISYRIEPLITLSSSKLKPVSVPYTKGGLTTQIQELSELGSKISQSASMMWTSLTSTLTKSDLLEEIKKTDEEEAKQKKELESRESKAVSIKDIESSERRQIQEVSIKAESDGDSKSTTTLSESQLSEVKERLSKLNPRGRVDYVLQEGVLDISILSAIASHVSYFENEDVASFIFQELYRGD